MKKILLLAAAGALLGAAPARAQLGLGMAPMRIEMKMTPGQQYSGPLRLSNQSGAKIRVRGEVLDFNIDDKATPQFERILPQEAAYSCKKWLSLNPMELELDKDESVNVRYTLRLPAELSAGSYNCAAGFSTLPAAEQMNGMGMRVAVRIVSAIYIVIGNRPIEGTLKEIKLEQITMSPEVGWQAVVVLENSGWMYFRPSGKLQVLDTDDTVVETLDFVSLPVLPQRSQRFLFPLKTKMAAGSHTVRASVDIGGGEIQEGTLHVAMDQKPAAHTRVSASKP